MARAFAPGVLERPEEQAGPQPSPIELLLAQASTGKMDGGVLTEEQPDGGVVVDFDPNKGKRKKPSKKFNENLAELLDDAELSKIAGDLLDGIARDITSSAQWLQQTASGIGLLGLEVEDTSSSFGTNSAPLEGMSRVKHPLLLDAVLFFTANALGETLPASGPVKVVDDEVDKPVEIKEQEDAEQQPPAAGPGAGMGDNGGPPLDQQQSMPPDGMAAAMAQPQQAQPADGSGSAPPMDQAQVTGGMPGGPMPAPMEGGGPPALPNMPFWAQAMKGPEPIEYSRQELCDALEKDMNHFLTKVATEYYPDTDRMNFNLGFSGMGIKKVYNCPIRRRPVSESVKIEDFIVSNALTDLSNAGRITHKIKMRPSIMKRMQILNVYRDVPLQEPVNDSQENPVEQKKAQVMGVAPAPSDPKDSDYTVYECCCELNIDQFAPSQFKGKGLPLPYKVTIEKQSEVVLEIRRNWREDDDQCLAREYFVDFPFVRAFGFYGIGLLHILGNTTKTLTASWREMIDSGMFANFPGFLYAKGAGRQLTSNFRIPPGGGMGLDVGLQSLKDAVMPLPYKSLDTAFAQFISHVEELGQRLGGTSQINVGEGRQDAPVGTTMALIEQATKPTSAVMKRLHGAHAKEFMLLRERFREDPEAFYRFNRKPTLKWRKDLLLQALNDFDIQPVSDPNNPTRLHRAAKGAALEAMATAAPALFDLPETASKVGHLYGIDDIDEVLLPPGSNAPQPDPIKMGELEVKKGMLGVAQQKVGIENQTKMGQQTMETQRQELENAQQMREIEGRQRIEELKLETARMTLAAQMAQHAEDLDAEERLTIIKILGELHKQGKEHDVRGAETNMKQIEGEASRAHEHMKGQADHQRSMEASGADQQHEAEMSDAERAHQAEQADLDRQHEIEQSELDRQAQIKAAAAKPKPTGAKK